MCVCVCVCVARSLALSRSLSLEWFLFDKHHTPLADMGLKSPSARACQPVPVRLQLLVGA